MKQYIVDAFTDTPFSGNPAAVCIMDNWPSEEAMLRLARENNLSETAFIVHEDAGYHLRWFTPAKEIELCGHATLASAAVLFTFFIPHETRIEFHTLSGILTVTRSGARYTMNFPRYDCHEIPVTEEMIQAFGATPQKALLGEDLLCIFDSADTVRRLTPDQTLLARLPGRIQNASAAGDDDFDCVSRSFAPKFAVPEDPVCGSSHCQIAPYWSRHFNTPDIKAYQASARGGILYCTMLSEDRMALSGEAVVIAISHLQVPLS